MSPGVVRSVSVPGQRIASASPANICPLPHSTTERAELSQGRQISLPHLTPYTLSGEDSTQHPIPGRTEPTGEE